MPSEYGTTQSALATLPPDVRSADVVARRARAVNDAPARRHIRTAMSTGTWLVSER